MTSNPDPDARSSYRLITVAARLVQRRQDDALAPLGLTRAAVIAMEGLAAGALNQEQLADVIRVQSQTLGRVLSRLEASGHITRTRHPTDRRQLRVELTQAGLAALEAARLAETQAYPDEFVQAFPASRDAGVVPFAAPEHRPSRRHATPRGGGTHRLGHQGG